MNNHYFQFICPNKGNVFEIPLRCSTPQAVQILKLFKDPKVNNDEIDVPGVTIPNIVITCDEEDLSGLMLEQVEAYFANQQLKRWKQSHPAKTKNFTLSDSTIKQAYREMSVKLDDFHNAKKLLAYVHDNSELVTDDTSLQQVLAVGISLINSGMSK